MTLAHSEIEKIEVLAGTDNFDSMRTLGALEPFSHAVLFFLEKLSSKLISHPEGRIFPEIVSFGFFIRKSNITTIQKSYNDTLRYRIGRGVTFHIAPSNVPINFAYSLITGLLSGNSCIVRVSSKDFRQVSIVNELIRDLLLRAEHIELRDRISILKYEHNILINQYFSELCDARLIWGGDNTIEEIRKAALPPRALDFAFSDRYSLCIIHAKNYQETDNKRQIAINFYNDTYQFDQNACTSPRLIYWVGEKECVKEVKNIFWQLLYQILLEKNYKLNNMAIVNKYIYSCKAALVYDDIVIESEHTNLINRLKLVTLPAEISQFSCGGGSYFEYDSEDLKSLSTIITRKFQTLTYIGFTSKNLFELLIREDRNAGIDRIVRCGAASDFNFTWDGHDLINGLTRVVYCV